VRTIAKWKANRLIPFVKVGGRVWYDPKAVRAALDQQFAVESRKWGR